MELLAWNLCYLEHRMPVCHSEVPVAFFYDWHIGKKPYFALCLTRYIAVQITLQPKPRTIAVIET